jgi:flavin reductase (DIM6/NTAB) family NADH-FMN oxidoreductase RutF
VRYDEDFPRLCAALEGRGAFLVAEGRPRANIMTVGWAQAGVIWGRPVLTVLVRPSRHTHRLLEAAGRFTLCVPRPGEMEKELAFCGTKSGRDYDKARACGLTLISADPGWSLVGGCEIVYQCETLATAELKADRIVPEILRRYYPEGDFHTLYFGGILKAERYQ